MDFAAGAAKVLIVIKGFPESQEGFVAWFCARVNKDTDLRVQDAAKSVEEPAVRIDLLAVLLFQTKDHLHWRQICWVITLGAHKLE